MNRLKKKEQNLTQRKRNIRSRLHGSAERPRLTVYISQKHITAQLIDDDKSHTLASATTVGHGEKMNGPMKDKAAQIGETIAKKAKKAKITRVVFDRNGRLYHGRVKALADAARKEGLEF